MTDYERGYAAALAEVRALLDRDEQEWRKAIIEWLGPQRLSVQPVGAERHYGPVGVMVAAILRAALLDAPAPSEPLIFDEAGSMPTEELLAAWEAFQRLPAAHRTEPVTWIGVDLAAGDATVSGDFTAVTHDGGRTWFVEQNAPAPSEPGHGHYEAKPHEMCAVCDDDWPCAFSRGWEAALDAPAPSEPRLRHGWTSATPEEWNRASASAPAPSEPLIDKTKPLPPQPTTNLATNVAAPSEPTK